MRAGRAVKVEVTPDGAGLISHAGTGLLTAVADRVGLTASLSDAFGDLKQRRRGHDLGVVLRDLAVMVADGGECVADLGTLRDQQPLFGDVCSDSTAFRTVQKIAARQTGLGALRAAHAQARARFWQLTGAPESLTIDVDATLINSHSEKEHAAGNYKGGYGFHPLQTYLDETRESLDGLLRPGNAGSNTAQDHKTVLDLALAQIPAEHVQGLEILVRSDSAGATHDLVDYCHDAGIRFSVGHDLSEPIRNQILQIPADHWVKALNSDGTERPNGEVAEITKHLNLKTWPAGSRVIVRRERPHPGAQLSFTDVDGYRFQAILTNQTGDIAEVECRHRAHAHVEDRIRDDKTTGLQKFPFKNYGMNEVWHQIVSLAHDLLIWTQALCLGDSLQKAEPKRLRYQLFHVAARLSFHARTARLHIDQHWPWANDLVTAFRALDRLAPAPG